MLFSSTPSSGLVFPEQVAHTRPASLSPGGDVAERAAINPFDPVALNNLAIAEASRGRYQQALMLLQRAAKLAPARPDIAANLYSLQRWLTLAEGQAAIGVQPQPLALPYQESLVPDVPPLWRPPPALTPPTRALPMSGAGASGAQQQGMAYPPASASHPSVLANPAASSASASTKNTARTTTTKSVSRDKPHPQAVTKSTKPSSSTDRLPKKEE